MINYTKFDLIRVFYLLIGRTFGNAGAIILEIFAHLTVSVWVVFRASQALFVTIVREDLTAVVVPTITWKKNFFKGDDSIWQRCFNLTYRHTLQDMADSLVYFFDRRQQCFFLFCSSRYYPNSTVSVLFLVLRILLKCTLIG